MLIVEKHLACDECGETFGDDLRSSAHQHRRNARKEGWLCNAGYDLCPDCRKKSRSGATGGGKE